MAAVVLACGPAGAQAPAVRPGIAPRGTVHSLVIFARFLDEAGGSSPPAWATQLFDPGLPGSLTHFYDEMSRGQFRLTGTPLPQVYISRSPTREYLAPGIGQVGGFGRFVTEVLQAADAEVDFGQFDNDGPDGVPNSGDDDGYVDFLFVVMQSTPSRFVISDADGIEQLGLFTDYRTRDASARGGTIRVRADGHPKVVGGTIQRGRHFAEAVGTMAHEFGHALGLPDLYDTGSVLAGTTLYPADDSAGIGYWGLMGHGTRGWNDAGGPNPLCAWSLEQLGWIGPDNADLVPLRRAVSGLELTDVNAGGKVYRIDTPGLEEYYLLEHRARGASYYERDLPAEGLLIWHVSDTRTNNNYEQAKRVDLVCADGLFRDAGYPLGQEPDPDGGGDNLDFWAHDEVYRQGRAGNLGDATDPFDGVAHTEFSPITNPASRWISVSNIHRTATGMAADVLVRDPRRAGTLRDDEVWSHAVEVIGDITVPRGRSLSISPGTVVRFGSDGRRSGQDPDRCELVVEGSLSAFGSAATTFTSGAGDPAAGDWSGIRVTGDGELYLRNAAVEYAVDGVAAVDLRRDLRLYGVTVRHALRHGVWLEAADGEHLIEGLVVEGAGGSGVVLEGPAIFRVASARLADNAGSGLVRSGGFLDLHGAVLVDNGAEVERGANAVLRQGAFGTVTDSRFRGGVGLRFEGASGGRVSDNEFTRHRIGLVSANAAPRVVANRFVANDLAMEVSGGRIPALVELNAVVQTERLLANASPRTVRAANNWWGQADADWIAARMEGPVEWEPYLTFDPRIPVGFALAQNYPNPFNASTVIEYTVGIAELTIGGADLTVLDIRSVTGALVRRVVEGVAAPGRFSAVWDGLDEAGRPAASGVYYYELRVGPIRLRRKLALLR